ncbi:MAG: IS1634 family transposase [Oligoflexia bacterium]|nr:IS1634 family transposase [Oligoflexia bacterium]
MAFITKKKSKYSTYYVIIENARVNGQSKVVKQWYLGTIDKIIKMAEGSEEKVQPREIDCVEYGSVAALCRIADELGLRDIVNSVSDKKRKQGMSTGDYILLCAINRALGATSESKLNEWVDSTGLHLFMNMDKEKITSQHVWNHFDRIDEAQVNGIYAELVRKAVEIEKINLDFLVYDTTNYYNYWDVLNPSELARMTKSKAGKNHLRHIGMALAVDRDYGIPVYNRLYPANRHDSVVFNGLLEDMFAYICSLVGDKKSLTFVFDKGNNSDDSIKYLDDSRHNFIGVRSPYHHKELCDLEPDKYTLTDIPGTDYSMPVYETRQELYGRERRIIVSYNELTARRQEHRLERNLEKAKSELSFFKKAAKTKDGRSTVESVRRDAKEILSRYHVPGLLDIVITENRQGFTVSARKNLPAIDEQKKRFGKQIIFTNRESISAGEIIKYYLDRYIVEQSFRITKSDNWVKWDPAFHWTDAKIRVHALTCMIALLLVRIAFKRAKEKGFTAGAERMLELLSGVKSAMMFYPKSSKPVRQLCSISEEQKLLLTNLNVPLNP